MITSKTNPKIKNLVKLQKASERREQNRILIEGQREIERAQACGFEIEQLYVCEPLLREPVKVKAAFTETVTEEVFDKIAYREGSDGLLAVAIPKYKSLNEFKPKKDALIIVLETVEKPGNLGAVMRTADAAGVDAVIVADPATDLYNPNAIRASIGCIFSVPVYACSTEECIKWLKQNGITLGRGCRPKHHHPHERHRRLAQRVGHHGHCHLRGCPPKEKEMKKDYFLLHLSVFIAGFTGVLGRLITLDSAILVWWRMATAALIMWAFLLITKQLNNYKLNNLLQMGGVGMLLCLHWVFFYASIKASNVSIGVVCFSLVGFFTALFEPIINRHRFSGREFLFSLLTILGIYLIFQFDARYRLGIVLGVVSSALYALFAIANQRVGKHYEAKNMLLWEMVGGLIGLTCLLPLYNIFIPVGQLYPVGMDYAYLAFMVVVCTIGLCLLQIIVLQRIPAFTVNLTYNLEPVYSIILSMFIFSEYKELNFSFCIGIALIIISVVLQTWSEIRRRKVIT